MSNHHYEEISWYHIGCKIAINAALCPVDNAKVLMQIGFEPIPPQSTKTLLGRPALGLPNIFKYLGYMKKRDGWLGLYRGCSSRVGCHLLSGLTFHQVTSRITFQEEDRLRRKREEDLSEEEVRKLFMMATLRDLGGRLACIVISHPLFVAKTRQVAQFVGQETTYTGLLGSLRAVYEESGLAGLFSGLVPRLLGDLLTALFVASLTYVVNNYLVEDKELKTYTASAMSYIGSALMYPYHVVATCSAVSGSSLVAGRPPFMPVYGSWRDCWVHLSAANQLKRGSSLFFRYYTGPQMRVGDQVVPLGRFPLISGSLSMDMK